MTHLSSNIHILRIKLDQTRLHLEDVGSDHQALIGNIRFNKTKLLIGIKTDPKKGLSSEEKQEISDRMKVLFGKTTAFSNNLPTVHQKLINEDTVVIENPKVDLLIHSLDLCFELTKNHRTSPSTAENQMISVSNVGSMFSFVEAYLT